MIDFNKTPFSIRIKDCTDLETGDPCVRVMLDGEREQEAVDLLFSDEGFLRLFAVIGEAAAELCQPEEAQRRQGAREWLAAARVDLSRRRARRGERCQKE